MALLVLLTCSYGQGVSKMFGLVGGSMQPSHTSNGFLFSTDSSGNNLQVQYDFPVTVSGALPANLEMQPYNGRLYGTTSQGGTTNLGTIFEYDPATNSYTRRFEFGTPYNVTGASPKGSLVLYNNKFYGLASEGGAAGVGTIFEWDPVTGIYTKKYDFTGAGGSYPQNSLRIYNGKMYGTTLQGGANNLGVVFEWNPATNAYTVLYDAAVPTGREFYNNLTVYNNKLYGTTHVGGTNNYGVLFVIDPALANGANYTVLRHFAIGDGINVSNNEMIVYNNKLYGCLNQGGANFQGSFFEWNPATSQFTRLVDFSYSVNGASPQGKLVANGSKFIGLCSSGGTNGTGTIFEWDPANPTVVTKKQEFNANNFDNTVNPGSTLTLFNGKFYAVSYNGGFVNRGTLFEYDPSANTIAKKLNFDAAETGRIPFGQPVLLNGKIYGTCQQGPQEIFGTPYGCLWSFDPSTSVYSRKIIFDNINNASKGRNPVSAPVAYNGKLYGTTQNGGVADYGVLYEFDPVTNAYAKVDMQPTGGAFPIGEPTVYNNKLYGMTNAGGNGNNGIIYSYDPATGVLAKLADVGSSGRNTPSGGFTVYNNKLYGVTSSGGAGNAGAIFSFDPISGTITPLYDLVPATGTVINNALTVYNNMLYGTAMGSATGRGCIFRFDPATNLSTLVYNFPAAPGGNGYDPSGGLTVNGNRLYAITRENNNVVKVIELDPATNTVTTKSSYTTTALNLPILHNGLTVVPAFIANGIAGSCENYPTVVINAANSNKWVPIVNSAGDVVAEIKANGNILGNVTASTYINNGAVREDPLQRLYMDRSITITTQNPVSTGNVELRLYVKTSEFMALRNATNSAGQPSGITGIQDIAVYKNGQACSGQLTAVAARLATTGSSYEYGYVLTTSVNSFSTFFFAKNTFTALPVTLLSFTGSRCDNKVCLLWAVDNEPGFLRYEIEKSIDGQHFSPLATVPARNTGRRDEYTATDDAPLAGDNYYRLKLVNNDGSFSYSRIIQLNVVTLAKVSLQPNPAGQVITAKGLRGFKQLRVVDAGGHVVLQQAVSAIVEQLDISRLPKGAYILQAIGDGETVALRFIKQ